MRKIGALFAAIACAAISGQASASLFTGTTPWTATGPTSLTAPGFPTLACTATVTGTINPDGTVTVTGAIFTGGQLGACSLVHLTLPIRVVAHSPTSVVLQAFEINAPVLCGSEQELSVMWHNPGPGIAFSRLDVQSEPVNPGGCTISAHLTVPGVTIN